MVLCPCTADYCFNNAAALFPFRMMHHRALALHCTIPNRPLISIMKLGNNGSNTPLFCPISGANLIACDVGINLVHYFVLCKNDSALLQYLILSQYL